MLICYTTFVYCITTGGRDTAAVTWPVPVNGSGRVYQWNRSIFSDTAMSGRLASFKGPSIPLSPESSPSGKKKSSNNRGTVVGNRGANPTPPGSPGRELESTFHRKIRALLLEIRSICRLWSDIVLHDGLKAAKTLVDARTELEYVSKPVFLDSRWCCLTAIRSRIAMRWLLCHLGRPLNIGSLVQNSESWTNRFVIWITSS